MCCSSVCIYKCHEYAVRDICGLFLIKAKMNSYKLSHSLLQTVQVEYSANEPFHFSGCLLYPLLNAHCIKAILIDEDDKTRLQLKFFCGYSELKVLPYMHINDTFVGNMSDASALNKSMLYLSKKKNFFVFELFQSLFFR